MNLFEVVKKIIEVVNHINIPNDSVEIKKLGSQCYPIYSKGFAPT